MKHPIFKPLEQKLTSEEEARLTKDLAEAYRQSETQDPEVKRIEAKLEEMFRSLSGE